MWVLAVERIFRALNERGGVSTNTTCGTHVHLRPKNASWSLEDLQKLSCCVLYFERVFEVLYPEASVNSDSMSEPSRIEEYIKNAQQNKRAIHAKANWVDNWKFGVQYEENVNLILRTKNIDELKGLMNPVEEKYNARDRYDRTFAWNFTNLITGGLGTVEYRRPPGVQSANACVNWVRLATTFVRAAIQVDDPYFPLKNDSSDIPYVSVAHLQRFLETGLPVGRTMSGCFGTFFDNKKGGLDVIPVKERYSGEDFD